MAHHGVSYVISKYGAQAGSQFPRLLNRNMVKLVASVMRRSTPIFELALVAHACAHGVMSKLRHVPTSVALTAALHFLAILPPFPHTASPIPLQNAPVVEFDRSPNPLRDELLAEPIHLVAGRVPAP